MHPQKKSYLFLLYLFVFSFICIFVAVLLHFADVSERTEKRTIACALGLCIYFWGMDYKNRSRKYVKFYDNHIRINAYNKQGVLKVFDLNIPYKDIRALRLKKHFILGTTYIEIDSNNVGQSIKIYRYHKRFNALCKTLYEKTLINSPDAKIEEELIAFTRRKK